MVLSQVLLDEVTVGFQQMTDTQVLRVNGVAVLNLRHVKELIDSAVRQKEPYLVVDLKDERVIVLGLAAAQLAHEKLLKRHRIPAAMSPDLVDEPAPNSGSAVGGNGSAGAAATAGASGTGAAGATGSSRT